MAIGEYGPLIRRAREATSLSMEDVAERLGVDRSTYNKMELGKKPPTLRQVNTLVNVLPLSAEDLLRSMGVALNPAAASRLPKPLIDRLLELDPTQWQSLLNFLNLPSPRSNGTGDR